MKKSWSRRWIASRQPRKQRKYRANAPLHARRRMLSAHLGKVLRSEFRRRSVHLRKDDEVLIVRGEHKGKSGKITAVDIKKMKVYVEGMKAKKVTGQEVDVPIDPSNLLVTSLNRDDRRRLRALKRGKAAQMQAPAKPAKETLRGEKK